MAVHKTEITVRFGDTDMAGVVYLPQYIHYFIIGWEEFFRSIGVPFEKMIKKEIRGLPPVKVNCRFKSPAFCGDFLEVHTRVAKMRKKEVTFKFDLYRKADKKLLATGSIASVPINEKFQAANLPEYILEAIKEFEES